MRVWVGHDPEGRLQCEVRVPGTYNPDILADMIRHAITSAGAIHVEDADDDLREDLEEQFRAEA